jgi:non-heme chloroperoxidase
MRQPSLKNTFFNEIKPYKINFMTKKLIMPALIFTVLGGITAGCSDSKNEKAASTAPNKPEIHREYVEVSNGVKLHITDLGTGTPVVLIHGYPLSDASWEYQYLPLVKQGYRVIGITLRGFGQSDKPYSKYNYDEFADDIKAVLDTLKIEGATLGGHSMGGAIAMHYVAKYNAAHVSKLALFAAAGPTHTKKPDYPYPFFTKEDISQWIELIPKDRPALLAAVGQRFTLNQQTVSQGVYMLPFSSIICSVMV